MRVISQDGTLDIPYEDVIIQRFESKIYFLNKNLTGVEPFNDDMQIAEYSTEEKAKKAMEMLRERHTDNVFCREDIQYKAEIMLDDGLDIVREMMMKCEYFQFPKDDEVKV